MKQSRFFSAIMLFSMAFLPCLQADSSSSHSHSFKRVKSGSVPVYLITQKDIPAVIKHSGEYILASSICYSGCNTAITVEADNVKLNLRNCTIHLENPNATGIAIHDSCEVIVEGDAIINTCHRPQCGTGIHVCKSRDVTLDHVLTKHHHNGLLISESCNVSVLRSEFSHPTHANATVQCSVNVSFDDCVFDGSKHYGVVFSGQNRDCRIINSDFPNAHFTNLLVQEIHGMIVDKCMFTNICGDCEKPALVQFGDKECKQSVRDVLFTNCTIINKPPCDGNHHPEGLYLMHATGVLVDSCIVDIDNEGTCQEHNRSAIHVGSGCEEHFGDSITIRNTICEGHAMNGIHLDVHSRNIVVDNCLTSNALKNGILLQGTHASVIKNSTITSNGTNGIYIGKESKDNALLYNVASHNGHCIICDSCPPHGAGVAMSKCSSANLIQDNQIFSNEGMNIQDHGKHNVFVNNTSF